MNTCFCSDVLWLHLGYRISTLVLALSKNKNFDALINTAKRLLQGPFLNYVSKLSHLVKMLNNTLVKNIYKHAIVI